MTSIEDIYKKSKDLPLKEKIKIIEGKGAWHVYSPFENIIKPFMMTDGPHGVRKVLDSKNELDMGSITENAVCFPTASLTACSFDENLLYTMGKTIAEEALSKKVKMILGPGVNIKRSPLCGRNFEYFSEDPFLAGKLGSAFINGLQSTGVACSLKHFACNNQEKRRFTYSANLSQRALFDIYLKPFEICVKEANPKTIMCSYNKINGVQVSQNHYILTDILRNTWDFQGVIVSDWGAVDSRSLSLSAGLDLEMPGVKRPLSYYKRALANNECTMLDIDSSMSRVLHLMYDLDKLNVCENKFSIEEERAIAKNIACSSMVLAKNVNNILPLNKKDNILVIGGYADRPRYQGNGSSHINSYFVDSFIDLLKKDEKKFTYLETYNDDNVDIDEVNMNKAISFAKEAKKIIIFISLSSKDESEGYDRKSLKLNQQQIDLVNRISEVNSNIVVILTSGAPVEIPFIDRISGLLITYLGGETTCAAIKDILYGDVNPSGKLAETWLIKLEDTPCSIAYLSNKNDVYYDEDIYVGYRHYETNNIPVLFPFGFGLSYANFEEKNFSVTLKDSLIHVVYDVSNISKIDGKYVGQVYIEKMNSSVYRCGKELKGFAKINVKKNSNSKIMIDVNINSLEVYDEVQGKNIIENGNYTVYVGNSIDDIIYKTEVYINGEEVAPKEMSLLERTHRARSKKIYTMNSTIDDISKTFIGKIILNLGNKLADNQDDDSKLMVKESLLDQPIRSAASFGQISYVRATAIVDWANKKYFRAIRKFIFNK